MKALPRGSEVPVERLGLAAVVVVAGAVGATTLGHAFVFDDLLNVVQNGWVRAPSTAWRALGTHFAGFDEGFAGAYYRPAAHLVFAGLAAVFGITPGPFHALNVLLHAATAGAVFLIARRLLGLSVGGAAVGALLFGVHPLNAESIAWVSDVTDIAATLLGCIVLLIGAEGSERWQRAVAVGALFLAALMFKEVAIAIPFVLVAVWAAHPVPPPRARLRAAVALGAAGAVYGLLRFAALQGLARTPTGERPSLLESASTAVALFGQYVAKLLAPVNLSALPVFPPVESVLDPRFALGIAALVGVTVLGVRWRRQRLVLAPALFLCALAPAVLGAAFGAVYSAGLGECLFADRYAYMASVGAVLAAAAVVDRASQRSTVSRAVALAAAASVIAVFSVACVRRLAVWSDEVSLWTDARAKAPQSATAAQYLGSAMMMKGRHQEAVALLSEATTRNPELTEAWVNLSYALSSIGRFDEATRAASRALQRTSRAEAHAALGYALAGTGRLGEAIDAYRRALALKPDLAGVHNSLAIAYANAGDVDRARAHFREAMRLAPEDATYAKNLALLE